MGSNVPSDLWYNAALSEKRQGDGCAAIGDWRGAYARYGTAAEFLLKAIYLRNCQVRELPPALRTAQSHDLTWLATQAGIMQQIRSLTGARRASWLVVRDWDQGRRYPNEPFPARDGKELKRALFNPSDGVWAWLMNIYQTN
jgi:hypothetical protein